MRATRARPSLQHSKCPIPPFLCKSQLQRVFLSISSALPSSGFCRDAGPRLQLRHETPAAREGLSRTMSSPFPCPELRVRTPGQSVPFQSLLLGQRQWQGMSHTPVVITSLSDTVESICQTSLINKYKRYKT